MNKIKKAGIEDKIKELWVEGYSADKIAEMTGGVVWGRSILRYLQRQGIDTSKTKRNVICKNCGKEFEKTRACFRKSRFHFCSMPCYWEHLKNPDYNRSVYGMRMARKKIREMGYLFDPENVVHHIDGDNDNNELSNLMVFKNQGDHNRWHRNGSEKSGVIPLWPKIKVVKEKKPDLVKEFNKSAIPPKKLATAEKIKEKIKKANEIREKRQSLEEKELTILEKAQKELDLKRVQTSKGSVKMNSSMANFFNPQPKRQMEKNKVR
jgi:hypothetical protein